MKKIVLAMASVVMSLVTFGQQNICYSTEIVNKMRLENPDYDQQLMEMENMQRKWVASQQLDPSFDARAVRTIPIVFHVLYNTTAQNVSDALIQQTLNQLNKDFSKTNTDLSTARSVVQPFATDVQIQFCLAQTNPSGQPTTGINRVSTSEACFDPNTETNKMKSASTNGVAPWNPQKYLNVWIVNICGSSPQTGGVAGYAYLPTNNVNNPATGNGMHGSSIDGMVISFNIGLGTGNRTLTHEIGHYLGLRHTWGDASSNACGNVFPNTDDGFNDTPDSRAPNYGCTPNTSCTGNSSYGDLYEDHMDYSSCTRLFTLQQANFMNNVLTNIRSSLVTNNNVCASTGAPVANFTATPTTICPGQTVQFTNASTGTVTTYAWQFPGGTPATSTSANPTVTYNTAGTYNVTLTVSNGTQNSTETKTAFITVATATALPLSEGFQNTTFPPTGWSLNNPDQGTTWVRTTSAGGFGASSASAYVNNYNYSSTGQSDWLITPSYSFSGVAAGRIKWDYAYRQYNQTGFNDSLEVLYSTNCGATWTSLWLRGGASLSTVSTTSGTNFVPTSTQWKADSVSLASLSGQANVRFAFRNRNSYGQNIFLDNVNIFNAAPTQVVAPVANFVGNPTTVTVGNSVAFTDLSTNNPTSWSWSFAGGTPATSTQQNPTIQYNTPGTYAVTLTATNTGGNDGETKTAYITVVTGGGGGTTCDTLSNILPNDTLTIYSLPGGANGTGYVSGHNSFGDKAKAEFYTNPTPGATVTGAILYFGVAKTLNTTSTITVKAWNANGTAGAPGTVIAQQNVTINSIKTNVQNSQLTFVNFTTPGVATGNFYIGFEMTYANGDTVAIVTTTASSPSGGSGWEQWDDNTWHDYADYYGVDFSNVILPILCTSSSTGPTANFTSPTSVCAGKTITFTNTSTGSPTSYSWTFQGGTPSTSTAASPTITYNTPGTYNVILTATNGGGSNTKTQSAYITVHANPTAQTSATAVACFGENTGSATVTPAGGLTPYTYGWSGGGNTASISNKSAGSYTVTVTDNRTCSVTTTANISQPLAALIIVPDVNDAICGLSNGSASVTANGGAGGYVYNWSTGANIQNISNLAAGSYNITVTDANSCTASAALTVTNQPSNLTVSISTTDAACGASDGSATANSNTGGSTATVTYVWNTSATTSDISNLSAGVYSVTATNNIGCTATASGTVNNSGAPSITFTTQQPSGGNNGSVSATVTGGSPTYTYTWSNGGTTSSISNLPAGTYTLTVTDQTGCVSIASVVIGTVGVNDILVKTLKLYPNPTQGLTSLQVELAQTKELSITVTNSIGQQVWMKSIANFNSGTEMIDMNRFAPGVYVISVQAGEISRNIRLVKE